MNVGMVNATCLRRSAVLVVEPHSRSISPDTRLVIRVDEFTGTYLTATVGRFNSRLTASTIFSQISIE